MNYSNACSHLVPSNLTALKFYRSFAVLISLLQEHGYETGDLPDYFDTDQYNLAFGLIRQRLAGNSHELIERSYSYEYVYDFIRKRTLQRIAASFDLMIKRMEKYGYKTDFIVKLFDVGESRLAWEMIYLHLAKTPNEAITSIEEYQYLCEFFGEPDSFGSEYC